MFDPLANSFSFNAHRKLQDNQTDNHRKCKRNKVKNNRILKNFKRKKYIYKSQKASQTQQWDTSNNKTQYTWNNNDIDHFGRVRFISVTFGDADIFI